MIHDHRLEKNLPPLSRKTCCTCLSSFEVLLIIGFLPHWPPARTYTSAGSTALAMCLRSSQTLISDASRPSWAAFQMTYIKMNQVNCIKTLIINITWRCKVCISTKVLCRLDVGCWSVTLE
jgi:hypothetical protein